MITMTEILGSRRAEIKETLAFIDAAIEGIKRSDQYNINKKEIEIAAAALMIAKKKISKVLDETDD